MVPRDELPDALQRLGERPKPSSRLPGSLRMAVLAGGANTERNVSLSSGCAIGFLPQLQAWIQDPIEPALDLREQPRRVLTEGPKGSGTLDGSSPQT